jgi:hypothetical protein
MDHHMTLDGRVKGSFLAVKKNVGVIDRVSTIHYMDHSATLEADVLRRADRVGANGPLGEV